jgi:hypothetical protein
MIIDVLIEGSTNGRAYAYDATGFDVGKGDYVKIPPTPFGDPRYAKVVRVDVETSFEGSIKPILGVVQKAEPAERAWKVHDPCGVCSSTNTDWGPDLGAHCLDCGATDIDE